MNSKQGKRTMVKAFRIFLIAALLVALVGSTTGVTYASDGAGNALDFDGTDDYVEILDNAALDADLDDSFTIEAWIRTQEVDYNMIFAKHSGGSSGSYYLATYKSGEIQQIQLTVITGTRKDYAVNFSYNDGKWHHVAGVYDGSDLKIYADGAQVGGALSQTGNVNNTDCPVRIGFYDGSPDWFYDGLYDEIRLWDDARTQAEIQANMHKTLAGSESGLVGYWKFDESSGTTADNAQGNAALDGTLKDYIPGNDDGNTPPQWVSSTAPIGDSTAGSQTDIAAMWANNTTASSSGLSIANSTFLKDTGDDIVFGHNNASDTTPNDCPSGVSPRWSRVWYLDKTDVSSNGGNVDITFDFSDAGFGSGPGASNYTLLKRDGTTGIFSGIATSSSISGDRVTFSDVDSTDLGSYFTLGEGTPTAVTLARFTARPVGRDLTGFGNLSGLGTLVALGAVGASLLWQVRRRRASKVLECPESPCLRVLNCQTTPDVIKYH